MKMRYVNFDRVASVYDITRSVPSFLIKELRVEVEKFIYRSYGTPPYRVLSLGIGTGRVESYLSSEDIHLFGLDISKQMLRELYHKKESFPINIILADLHNIPLRKNFDLAIGIHLIHLLEEPKLLFEEIRKICKIVIIGDIYTAVYTNPVFKEFKMILTEMGLKDEEEILKEYFPVKWTIETIEKKIKTRITHQSILDSIERKYFSSLWTIPDNDYSAALDELKTRLTSGIIDLDGFFQTESVLRLNILDLTK